MQLEQNNRYQGRQECGVIRYCMGGIIPGCPVQGAALDDLQSLGASSADLIPEDGYISNLAFRVSECAILKFVTKDDLSMSNLDEVSECKKWNANGCCETKFVIQEKLNKVADPSSYKKT